MLKRILYEQLNSRQKENYNFQKLAAKLADYGFNCMWLNDDWQGADCIACHIDGITFRKIQLKGRLTFDKKYNGKEIDIAFCEEKNWYLYPHDELMGAVLQMGLMTGSRSWESEGNFTWPRIPARLFDRMHEYLLE